jgi:hypothetical protein
MSCKVYVVRRQRVADARLHVPPPAVVGAAEAHEMRAAGVIAGQAYRLHDRLGARHVKRHFVEPRDRQQPANVGDGDRMIGAQHRPQIGDPLAAAGNALLVKIVTEDVDPVGTRQVIEAIAIEIGDHDARRGFEKGARFEMFAHQPAELKGHPISRRELQIGDGVDELGGHGRCFA